MITTKWPKTINTKFYSYSEEFIDNSQTQEYASGRKIVFLKNTAFLKKIKCSITLTMAEYNAFNQWYKTDLGGLAGAFTCTALGTSYYRFSSVPKFSTGQIFKTAELNIEEVY